jgi:tRNA A37 threonylcarbamoyladenosine modification protein TsaB
MRAAFGADESGGTVVSLSRDGQLLAVTQGTPRSDALALLQTALKEAAGDKHGILEIAVDRGPDGFSSVRRRVAVAVGLARALAVPLASFSGLSPAQAAVLPSSDFDRRAVVVPLYASAPNITDSKKKKTWTTR